MLCGVRIKDVSSLNRSYESSTFPGCFSLAPTAHSSTRALRRTSCSHRRPARRRTAEESLPTACEKLYRSSGRRYGRTPTLQNSAKQRRVTRWEGEILCGTNPYLRARLVDDFTEEGR